jgi:hypothetical protein
MGGPWDDGTAVVWLRLKSTCGQNNRLRFWSDYGNWMQIKTGKAGETKFEIESIYDTELGIFDTRKQDYAGDRETKNECKPF